jgi:hypothetical protein
VIAWHAATCWPRGGLVTHDHHARDLVRIAGEDLPDAVDRAHSLHVGDVPDPIRFSSIHGWLNCHQRGDRAVAGRGEVFASATSRAPVPKKGTAVVSNSFLRFAKRADGGSRNARAVVLHGAVHRAGMRPGTLVGRGTRRGSCGRALSWSLEARERLRRKTSGFAGVNQR